MLAGVIIFNEGAEEDYRIGVPNPMNGGIEDTNRTRESQRHRRHILALNMSQWGTSDREQETSRTEDAAKEEPNRGRNSRNAVTVMRLTLR